MPDCHRRRLYAKGCVWGNWKFLESKLCKNKYKELGNKGKMFNAKKDVDIKLSC